MELTRDEELLRLKLQLAQSKSYLDMKDVMIMTGYSYSTIQRRIEDGVLKSIQHTKGGKRLFKKEDVDRWLENGAR